MQARCEPVCCCHGGCPVPSGGILWTGCWCSNCSVDLSTKKCRTRTYPNQGHMLFQIWYREMTQETVTKSNCYQMEEFAKVTIHGCNECNRVTKSNCYQMEEFAKVTIHGCNECNRVTMKLFQSLEVVTS